MKVLHTSDWHIGRTLHDKKRHDEHRAFLDWLLQVISERQIDLLLVCGDIFDTITPGNRQLELYYSFLRSALDMGCRHIIIIGGNHDSPSLLDAPRQVLQPMGVHVIGSARARAEEEVIVLHDPEGKPEAVVCAVPYLRDRDVRTSVEQEDAADKSRRLAAGIAQHYEQVCAHGAAVRDSLSSWVPMIVTGHLFTTGASVLAGDGVRDLYVGTALEVSASMFPPEADYVALGHLHVPQKVAGSDTIRYSGSPIPMGFGEASTSKQILEVEFLPDTLFCEVETLSVPMFQRLERISGTLEAIEASLGQLVQQHTSIWVEVEYEGTLSASVLREHLETIIDQSAVQIIRLRNTTLNTHMLHGSSWQQTLDELDEREVFRRRLEMETLEPEEADQLKALYESILFSFNEEL